MDDPKNFNAIFERPVENQHWGESVDAKDSQDFHGAQSKSWGPADLGIARQKRVSFMSCLYESVRCFHAKVYSVVATLVLNIQRGSRLDEIGAAHFTAVFPYFS